MDLELPEVQTGQIFNIFFGGELNISRGNFNYVFITYKLKIPFYKTVFIFRKGLLFDLLHKVKFPLNQSATFSNNFISRHFQHLLATQLLFKKGSLGYPVSSPRPYKCFNQLNLLLGKVQSLWSWTHYFQWSTGYLNHVVLLIS